MNADIIYYDGKQFKKLPEGISGKTLPEEWALYWYVKILQCIAKSNSLA